MTQHRSFLKPKPSIHVLFTYPCIRTSIEACNVVNFKENVKSHLIQKQNAG